MPSVTNLTGRDLEGVLGVVAEAAAAEGETPFDQPLIERLARLVSAERGGYYEHTPVGRSVFHVESGGVCDEENVRQWTDRVAEHFPHWPLDDDSLGRLADGRQVQRLRERA